MVESKEGCCLCIQWGPEVAVGQQLQWSGREMGSRVEGDTQTGNVGNTRTNKHRLEPMSVSRCLQLGQHGGPANPAPSRWNSTHSKRVAQRIWRRKLSGSWRNCQAVPCQQNGLLDRHELRDPPGILHQPAESCCCFLSAFPISSKFLLCQP